MDFKKSNLYKATFDLTVYIEECFCNSSYLAYSSKANSFRIVIKTLHPYQWLKNFFRIKKTKAEFLEDLTGSHREVTTNFGEFIMKKLCIFTAFMLAFFAFAPLFAAFESSTVNGDVIVTDTKTELVWQKSYVSGKTWQEALVYCENLTYAGYSDWRLPDKNELASLVNYEKYSPASDFPDMPSNYFWSSSTSVGNTYYAWYVHFVYGNVNNYSKTNYYNLRCVR